MIAAILFLACTNIDRPADLVYDHVACDSCGMVVSDARFAAQLVTRDGERTQFDDPACLFHYVEDHAPAIAHAWFHDSTHADDPNAWLDWQQVAFVEQAGAPMDGGIAAVPIGAGTISFSEASAKVLGARR